MKVRYSLRTLVFLVPLAMVYYPCVLLGAILVLAVAMPLGFFVDCSFTNATDETVLVTPIGTVGIEGSRRLLPLHSTSFSYSHKFKRSGFRVGPGETFRFSYDMDDINFSELVVKRESGELGQLIANPNPTASQYVDPDVTDFLLGDFANLKLVPENVAAAAQNELEGSKRWVLHFVCIGAFVVEIARLGCHQLTAPSRSHRPGSKR